MLADLSHRRLYFFGLPTDMRKGFNGLSGLVNSYLQKDLLTGDVFIFINKSRDKLKLLCWEHNGFAIYYKQLEQGSFEIPGEKQGHMQLNWRQLYCILEGIKLSSVHQLKRYKTGVKTG